MVHHPSWSSETTGISDGYWSELRGRLVTVTRTHGREALGTLKWLRRTKLDKIVATMFAVTFWPLLFAMAWVPLGPVFLGHFVAAFGYSLVLVGVWYALSVVERPTAEDRRVFTVLIIAATVFALAHVVMMAFSSSLDNGSIVLPELIFLGVGVLYGIYYNLRN